MAIGQVRDHQSQDWSHNSRNGKKGDTFPDTWHRQDQGDPATDGVWRTDREKSERTQRSQA